MRSPLIGSLLRSHEDRDVRGGADGWQARLTRRLDHESEAFEAELLAALAARQAGERRVGAYELPIYQRHEWLRASGLEHRLFQLRDPSGQAAMQIALTVARPRRAPMLAHARAWKLGPAVTPEAEAAALPLLRALCEEAGDLVSVRLQPHRFRLAPLGALEAAALSAGFRRVEPLGVTRTLFVDLRPDAEELLRRLSKKTRAKIRHAGRRSCEIRPLTEARWAPALAAATNASLARTGGGIVRYDIPAALALAAADPHRARAFGLFLPERPDELLAFVLGVRHGKVAEYALAGSHSDRALRALHFNYWLLWELLGWARASGAVLMDLGGITAGGPDDPRAGISHFKRHFSEDEREVGRELEVDLQPLRAAALRAWTGWRRPTVGDAVRALVPARLRRLRHTVSATHKTMFYAPREALLGLQASVPARYRVGTAADLEALGARHGYEGASVSMLARRLAEGDRLVLAEQDGEIVFSGWLSTGRMELPRAHVAVPDAMGYAYKLFTPADRRGQGLMRGFYGFVARELLSAASPGVIACVVQGNQASHDAHVRVGFAPVGAFWDVRAGGASLALTDEAIAGRIGRRFAATLGD